MSAAADGDVVLLYPREVAFLFRVDPKTVTRWAAEGRLLAFRTPGGSRRYYAAEVGALLRGETREQARKLAEAERERLTGGVP